MDIFSDEEKYVRVYVVERKGYKKYLCSYLHLKLTVVKDECYGSVKTISDRINSRDPDMMSHVIMSVFKVASAEANVPGPPPTTASVTSGASKLQLTNKLTFVTFLCALLSKDSVLKTP